MGYALAWFQRGSGFGWLPRGQSLAPSAWRLRHHIVLGILVAHIPFLLWFGATGADRVTFLGGTGQTVGLAGAAALVSVLVVFTLLAALPRLPRRLRSVFAATALISSSALLTHFSGGYIEAHFHFFVVLGILAFYQDWLPFSLGIVYIAIHHGLMGMYMPNSVYNHAAGIAYPWSWAFVHAGFILMLATVLVLQANLEARALERQAEAVTQAEKAREKQAAAAADAERERDKLRLVLENSDSIVVATDRNLRFTLLHGKDLAGVSVDPKLALGTPLHDMVEGDPKIIEAYETAVAGKTFVGDLQFRGRVFHCLFLPQRDPATGEIVGMMGCATDVTERVRTEEVERQALLHQAHVQHLQEVEAFRRQLLNTTAHELNTPLTPMKVQLELLASGHLGPLPAAQKKAVDVLTRNTDRLGGLVKDMLDVARIQNGRLELHHAPLDLSRVVADAAESFQAQAGKNGVHLILNIPQSIPLHADGNRLMQVIYNLISNAIRYTPRDGTVSVTATRSGDRARLEVRDTGAGFPPDDQERLFQPFSRLHPHERHWEGSGLGLYIARGIIEQHGGRIWAESRGPGQGALFAFDVPLVPPPPSLNGTPPAPIATLPHPAPTPRESQPAEAHPPTAPASARNARISDPSTAGHNPMRG